MTSDNVKTLKTVKQTHCAVYLSKFYTKYKYYNMEMNEMCL